MISMVVVVVVVSDGDDGGSGSGGDGSGGGVQRDGRTFYTGTFIAKTHQGR